MSDPLRLALVGGTFDPPHRGHLEPLRDLAAPMGWDRIVYIPAATQPFKQHMRSTPRYHRWAMAILAFGLGPKMEVSPIELERGEVSYTVDTLETLRKRYPDASLEWVVGDDNLELLAKWHRFERIMELANFVVLARLECDVPDEISARVVREAGGRPRQGVIAMARNHRVPISATEIRQRVSAGETISGLVSPEVDRYIHRYGLYRGEGPEL